MAVILLKIPTGKNTWVEGESRLYLHEKLLLVEQVSYEVEVESELHLEGRRTVHAPHLSSVTLERRMDMGSAEITRSLLSTRVSKYPWELYFFKAAGGGIVKEGESAHPVLFMTMKLHRALIQHQTISAEDDGDIMETLEVAAAAVQWEYTAFSSEQRARGKAGFTFDVQVGRVL